MPKLSFTYTFCFFFFFFFLIFACKPQVDTPQKQFLYFENGKVRREYQLINGLKEGVMVDFYPDGKIKTIRNFTNDLQTGKTIIYHPNGRIKEVQYYDDNAQREKGDTVWYDNGLVEYTAEFEKNKKNGFMTKFDSTGNLIYKVIFSNDSLVKVLDDF
jgi:antitoxin component YwqK of YwqJK toxin-antitoxin module